MILFSTPLIRARPKSREKRFFLHCELEGGTPITAHCANTGSMKGSLDTAVAVWLTHNPDPSRKLAYSLELAEQPDGSLVGLHTGRTNHIVAAALKNGDIAELSGAQNIKQEAKYSTETRFDFKLEINSQTVWLEVKNVTMKIAGNFAAFPDAVTTRGAKHLHTLAHIAAQPNTRAVQLYVVNRPDCSAFRPATEIDPAYTEALKTAMAAGVEVLAYAADVSLNGIKLAKRLALVV